MSFKSVLIKSIEGKPWLVGIIKRGYKSYTLNNWHPFQKWVLARCAAVDARMPPTPRHVFIETVLTCNAKCRLCAHSKKRMTGEMSMKLFEKLIDEVVEMGLGHVSLSIYGEPFVDKHWMYRIRATRRRNLTYDFFSNGSLLRQDQLEEMFDLGGWRYVNFSINGLSAPIYEQLMPPLKRNVVYDKVEMFLEMKKALGNGQPNTTISFVQTKENFHERHDFVNYWKSKKGVDFVILADCGDWFGEVAEENLTPDNRNKYLPIGSWLPPCRSIWENLYVYWDGKVAPCCLNSAGRDLIVGDANKNTLKEIFTGDDLTKLRKMHKNNLRSKHSVCGICRFSSQWIIG